MAENVAGVRDLIARAVLTFLTHPRATLHPDFPEVLDPRRCARPFDPVRRVGPVRQLRLFVARRPSSTGC
jgi:hypothetical protein